MKNKNDDLESVIDRYSDMLYKICFLILKNEHDTKDVLQGTFQSYFVTESSQFFRFNATTVNVGAFKN